MTTTVREQAESHALAQREARERGEPVPPWPTGLDLSDANLSGAHLRGAHLSFAHLRGAHLSFAHLRGAHLRGADLSGAHLSFAHLRGADLSDADLSGANLSGADLRGATGLRRDGMPDPRCLRAAVAVQIRQHPETHDHGKWGTGDPSDCDTPCCVAGWACRLGGGTYGLTVSTAATIMLRDDELPMPSFSLGASREDLLAALEARGG